MNLLQYLEHAAHCDRMRTDVGERTASEGYRVAADCWRQLASVARADQGGLRSNPPQTGPVAVPASNDA